MSGEIKGLAQVTVEWASVFSQYQASDGSIETADGNGGNAELALSQVLSAYEQLCSRIGGFATDVFKHFDADVTRWRDNGLSNQPNFIATHEGWRPSEQNNELVPFLGPVRIPNGIRGNAFILNFALTRRQNTLMQESVYLATQELPKYKEITIVDAPVRSFGYSGGEGSVLFSELLSSEKRRGPQTFGAFIISDFFGNYTKATKDAPIMKGPQLARILEYDITDDPVDERAMWLQVHDNYHDKGDLPHSEYLPAKMNFATAILDELKADGCAYLALRKLGDEQGIIGARHLIDKMFRFPHSPHAYMSVDGAVGELFLKEALRAGTLYSYGSDGLEISLQALDSHVEKLTQEVLAIEAKSLDVEMYIDLSRQYLHQHKIALPPNREPLKWADTLRNAY